VKHHRRENLKTLIMNRICTCAVRNKVLHIKTKFTPSRRENLVIATAAILTLVIPFLA
jgi:hypothetical protein